MVTCALRVALRAPYALLCTAALPPEQAVPAAAALAAAPRGAAEIVLLDGEGEAAEGWRGARGGLPGAGPAVVCWQPSRKALS